MILRKNFTFILFFWIISFNSQIISGVVKNNKGESLSIGNVLLFDFNNVLIQSSKIEEGIYTIKSTQKISKGFYLIVKTFKYEDKIFNIEKDINEDININFVLVEEKNKIKNIEEVIILKKKSRDTLNYDLNKYKAGNEKKLEDLLSKLPYITVQNDGKILYKGNEIQTINLNGVNILSKNYELASKNLSADIVEGVEAIENYNENPILRKIYRSNNVALNIKLKKVNKSFYDINVGLGYNEKIADKSNFNIISLYKNLKFFNVFSHNNIGKNNTINSGELINFPSGDSNYSNAYLYQNGLEQSIIDIERYKFNNNSTVSSNFNFEIGDKVTTRTNFLYNNDNINFFSSKVLKIFNNNSTEYYIEDGNNKFLNNNSIYSEFNVKSKSQKKYFFDYNFKGFYQNNYNRNNFFLNEKNINENGNYNFSSFLNNLDVTYEISPKIIAKSNTKFSFINQPEETLLKFDNQQVKYNSKLISNSFSIDNILYLKNKNKSDNINFGFENSSYYFQTKDLFYYNQGSFYNGRLYTKFNKNLLFLKNNIDINTDFYFYQINNRRFFKMDYNLKISRNIHNYSKITFNAGLRNNPFDFKIYLNDYFIENSFQYTKYNILENFSSQNSYSLNYTYDNDIKLLKSSIGFLYFKIKNPIIPSLITIENKILNQYVISEKPYESYKFKIDLEKYIPKIKTTLKFSTDLSLSKTLSFINSFKNQTNSYRNITNLYFGTIYFKKMKFSNDLIFNYQFFENNTFKNSYYFINNKTNLNYFLNEKLNFSIFQNVINDSQKNNFLVYDFYLNYKKNDKTFSIEAYNLLNNKSFIMNQINEYSETLYYRKIRPITILLVYNFYF